MDIITYLLIGGLVLLSVCSILMRVMENKKKEKKEGEKKEE